jgi:hypothetical protein
MTCEGCKGIRFKRCQACGGEINSFGDHREHQRPRQVYETKREWQEVNGTPEQKVPGRRSQP